VATYRLLVTDAIDAEGVALLRAEPSFVVDEVATLSREELLGRIDAYDALVGRSATRVPAELLRRGGRLRVIGRAGVGTDNIDLDAATALGIVVINAPAGNTVAVAELFFGSLLGLLRHLPRAAAAMRGGGWDRALFLGTELRGRTLGVVGLGRIGGEVARRARAFEMELVGYDPYVTDAHFDALRVRRAPTLDALLAAADVLTVHTPLTDETRALIGPRELARLPDGAIVVNMARGGIVDEAALAAALASGGVRGAVLDVFQQEPLAADHPLRTLDNVLLTPHIGASTAEGQRNVAVDVCVGVREALLRGELSRAVNVAGVGASWDTLRPALLLARRGAAVARALLAEQGGRAVQQLSLRVGRDLADGAQLVLAAAAAGVLEGVTESERLNLVNARALAEARGLELAVSTAPAHEHGSTIHVALRDGVKEIAVAGIAAPDSEPRLTRIGAFHVDVTPRHTLLILTNADVPGVIGRVGTLLGDAGVNIAEYHQARLAQGGEALAAVSVDGTLTEAIRRRLLALPDVRSAAVVNFRDEAGAAAGRSGGGAPGAGEAVAAAGGRA
jgi:D-3-phosphoglycerate dehydrogenase